MTKYLIVDTANTFFRARHVAFRGATLDEKVGLSIHITMIITNSNNIIISLLLL